MSKAARSFLLVLVLPSVAFAETYRVGPTRELKQLGDLTKRLQPGDVVELDGGATYAGDVHFVRPGTADQKITVRGVRDPKGRRPIVAGGVDTISADADHYVFEALDITGGSRFCFFHHADDITLRDSVVHHCKAQGILGGDNDTGSMLLEHSEVHHCGNGQYDHQIYMAADPVKHPEAVFRMQFNWVHDGVGGNNVKTRAPRNEIYYNWIEGAFYHELECIGSDGHPEDAVREDSDIVGNVLVKSHDFPVTRFGGDGTGQTKGRYRFVGNTVIVVGKEAVFRLFDALESLEISDNVFASTTNVPLTLVRENEVKWVGGKTTIAGSHNFIPQRATAIPAALVHTLRAANPGFVDLAHRDLHPRPGSPLVDAGTSEPPPFAAHPFLRPLVIPLYLPPLGAALAPGAQQQRVNIGAPDLGALEQRPGRPARGK